jgi:hypothetical protein
MLHYFRPMLDLPGDPPHVSGAVIGLVAGLAVAVTGANVWYFRYRRHQDALARENDEYIAMEAQE